MNRDYIIARADEPDGITAVLVGDANIINVIVDTPDGRTLIEPVRCFRPPVFGYDVEDVLTAKRTADKLIAKIRRGE